MVIRKATRDGIPGYEIKLRVGDTCTVLWNSSRASVESLAAKYLQRVGRIGKPLTQEQVRKAAKRGTRFMVEL